MLGPILPPTEVYKSFQGQKSGEKAFLNPTTNQASSKHEALLGFESAKQKRFDQIYAHELAHQSTGGSLAGGIVMELDGNGVAVGGHVNIKTPVFDKRNPDECLKQAEIVYRAAMAPGDPSSQDKAVASNASNIMSQAFFAIKEKDAKKGLKEPNQGNKLDLYS